MSPLNYPCPKLPPSPLSFIFFEMHRFKNETLFELRHNEISKDSKILAIFDHVANILKEKNLDSSWEGKLKEKIRIFCSDLTIKWRNAHRNLNNFKSNQSNWLQVETVFDHLDTDADIVLPAEPSTSGRPRLSNEEKSLRSKRREAAHLSKETQQHDPKLIVHAASISARQKGDNVLAAVLKEVNRSPSRPSKKKEDAFYLKKGVGCIHSRGNLGVYF